MELPMDVAALVGSGRCSSSSSPSSASAAEKSMTKKCRVCGDKALAFNFNGLSCESCLDSFLFVTTYYSFTFTFTQTLTDSLFFSTPFPSFALIGKAFFRRNALRQSSKILFCLQGGNCDIDITTRKFCPRCRLTKCFAIGMRKELVMAREEKLKKRQKGGNGNGNGRGSGGGSSDGEATKNIFNLAYLNCQSSSPSSSPASSSSESCEKHSNYTSAFSPNSNFDNLNLGAFEAACFGEVKRAGKVFLSKPQQENATIKSLNSVPSDGKYNQLQALSLQETYIKKIIDFCKSLVSSFACIKSTDQMIMVKNFFEDSLAIRCAFHYDWQQDGFLVTHQQQFSKTKSKFDNQAPETDSPQVVLKLPVIFPANKQHHLETYRKFIYALHNELEGDKNIRDLLITISLFKYTDDVSCPEFVRYNHVLFCRLLHRYLESKYQDGERANEKYAKLMGFSERMWAIKELICETYVDMNVEVAATVLDGIYHFSRAEVF